MMAPTRSILAAMRSSVVAVLVLLCASAWADTKSMKEAHDRFIERQLVKAIETAKKMPPISDKEFVAVWRKSIDSFADAVCKCEPEYSVTYGEAPTNGCVQEAGDEFLFDLMLPMLRIPGMADGITNAKDSAAASKLGEAATADLLARAVPPKEVLRRVEKLRRCMKQAGAL